ncbi:DNA integrity scanning protein DisA nucleotide-binding domain protein [Thermodesulfatator atlanticus]|uniref:DNA integrity scanning protein DisA nucleotide-binding domain protein n=1 Tax=Thermodesulfatator atlanticus TaxID=501497 RepID=UPI0003B2F50B|nr:diadenylate cyclase [Thermodesulfatator atlanticus]
MVRGANDFKRCLTEKLLDYAAELSKCIPIRAVMVYADVFKNRNLLDTFIEKLGETQLVLVSREELDERLPEKVTVIRVPHIKLTRLGQMKIAILVGISRDLFLPDDIVLCLSGIAESGFLDALFILDIGDEFEFFDVHQLEHLPEVVRPEVFLRVLEIAVDLAVEGREGKPVGTLFIVGDTERVLEYCEQLVLNPFKGYSEEERNILDPSLEETVKEFASLDGAFIIRGDGVIETAGAFIKAGGVRVEIPPGLGARHRSAAAITAITDAIAITVSESTGTVMVFYGGKIIMEIERPMIIGSLERGETRFGGIPTKEGII